MCIYYFCNVTNEVNLPIDQLANLPIYQSILIYQSSNQPITQSNSKTNPTLKSIARF